MGLKKKMASRKRSFPPPDSEQPLQNDVAQEQDEEDAASSESDKSSPKPSMPCVKSVSKPNRKRASHDKGGIKKVRVENETVEEARGVNEKDDVVIENGVEVDDDEEEENEGLDFKEMYPYLSEAWESDVSFLLPLKDFSVRNFTLIASEKMRALDKEWKDVVVKDLQLYLNKLDLKSKLAKVVLDQMTSSGP